MTAWATLRRAGIGAVVPLFLLCAPVYGDEPSKSEKSAKPTPAQLRAAAEKAEKAGDWDAAFTAYCHLFVTDRASPDIREKLNTALRRSQQLRRHRDPQFQQYAANTSPTDAMKLYAEVLTKVPVLYVDRERATPQILWENGLEELARALGDPAFRQAFLDDASADSVERFRNSLRTTWARQSVANAADARLQLRKLTAAAQDAFSVRVPSALVIEVVCGACSGLDEYTVFLNPLQLNPNAVSSTPDLSAPGIYLTLMDGALVIAGIAPGSWAAHHTKLRKGDRIALLNTRQMEMTTLAAAAEALRNPVEVFHEIETAGAGPDNPSITVRVPVIVPTVYGIDTVNAKEGVGYARIGSFSPTTARELDDAINSLKSRGVRVLILDLRGNMGGAFLAGVDTAKRLIPAGVIVTTQGQVTQADNQQFSSESGMTAHDLPVVLLVDAETASAAEVLAAALKDHNRATLIGMPTFGKGAIQYPVRLDSLDDKDENGKPKANKTGGIRLTIARLIAPRGGAINGVGITPHVLEADTGRQFGLAVEKAIELLPTVSRPLPASPMLPTLP